MSTKHNAVGAVNRKKVLVKVIEAKDLIKADTFGLSDPFTILSRNGDDDTEKQTSVKDDTLTPVWNEEFEFEILDEVNDVIDLEVMDFNKVGRNTFMGVAHIPLLPVSMAKAPLDQWFVLLDRKARTQADSKTNRGSIHVSVIYTDSEGVTHSSAPSASATAKPMISAADLDKANGAATEAFVQRENQELKQKEKVKEALVGVSATEPWSSLFAKMEAYKKPPAKLNFLEEYLAANPKYRIATSDAVAFIKHLEAAGCHLPGYTRAHAIFKAHLSNTGDLPKVVEAVPAGKFRDAIAKIK